MGEEELVRRIRQGEKELLGELVDRYYQEIFQFCYYKTGSEHAAYDCAQETFLRMVRFLGGCREANKFKRWLLRIALNVCRDHYREGTGGILSLEEQQEHAGGILSLEEQQRAGERGRSWDPAYAKVEDGMVIQQCLMRLTECQREVIILHFYHGYKVREIAAVTGVPLPTAKSRLKQGLERLRKIFREEGICEEDW